jgi:hypothetical protein
LSESDDDWRDLDYTPAVDRWFARLTRRGPEKLELTKSQYLPAKRMTAEEFAAFQAKGRTIDYCLDRADKQLANDKRHEDRTRQHPLFDVVVDVVAGWDCADYLAKHRKIVGDILGMERNARRRKLEGLSIMARRHQQAVRLVHALAFDGLNAAEYCRRHQLDKADASRMLQHLYEKEPGLADAIGAVSACAATTSWQNRQRNRKFHYRERGVQIVYGYDYRDVADHGWLSDMPRSGIRSYRSGRFKPIEPIAHEPFRPLDLHLPETWRKLGFSEVDWDALYEPMRAVRRCDVPLRYGMFDRYRAISRKLRIKDQPETGKPRYRTWRIARAIPFYDRLVWALGHCPQHWYPIPDIWVGWDPTQARYQTLAIVTVGYEPDTLRTSSTVAVRLDTREQVGKASDVQSGAPKRPTAVMAGAAQTDPTIQRPQLDAHARQGLRGNEHQQCTRYPALFCLQSNLSQPP